MLKIIQYLVKVHNLDPLKDPHCTFSSNLFNGQITQKRTNQLSFPEDIKWSPWKVFGLKPPSNPASFDKEREALDAQMRGCLNITSAQKWYAVIFQISAEKSFQAWQKKFPALIEWM